MEFQCPEIYVLNKVNEYLDKVNLKLEDCIAVSDDGAPVMWGRVNAFFHTHKV